MRERLEYGEWKGRGREGGGKEEKEGGEAEDVKVIMNEGREGGKEEGRAEGRRRKKRAEGRRRRAKS